MVTDILGLLHLNPPRSIRGNPRTRSIVDRRLPNFSKQIFTSFIICYQKHPISHLNIFSSIVNGSLLTTI